MRKFGMFFGAIITLVGLSIMFTPLRTYLMIGWITGSILVCNGITTLGSGIKGKELSKCIAGIVTTIIGLVLLGTDFKESLSQDLTIYLVTGGIIITGLIELLVGCIMVKKDLAGMPTLVLGAISSIVGITGLIFKDTTAIVIGVVVGYHIIRVGISIFNSARNMDKPIIID